MANEYDIRTIVDMARIPDEAFPRFLAELPIMINTMRGLVAMMDALHEAGAAPPVTDEAIMESIKGARWVDDDKGNVDISVKAMDAESGNMTELFDIAANYKTGKSSIDIHGAAQ